MAKEKTQAVETVWIEIPVELCDSQGNVLEMTEFLFSDFPREGDVIVDNKVRYIIGHVRWEVQDQEAGDKNPACAIPVIHALKV